MRMYAWLVVGLLVCHQSLTLFGSHPQVPQALSSMILNPNLFLQAALLMLIGLLMCSYSVRNGLIFTIHQDWQTHTKVVCGMIYFITLILGWVWLILTFQWGGTILIALTLIHFFTLWDT